MKWSYYHRLRKYARKKYNNGFDDWKAILYWRYHFKLYEKHELVYQPSLMKWDINASINPR